MVFLWCFCIAHSSDQKVSKVVLCLLFLLICDCWGFPQALPLSALCMVGYRRTNDLLLVRQDIPLHTTCRSLNFVYFSIPVDQVAPNNTIREDGRSLKSKIVCLSQRVVFRLRPSSFIVFWEQLDPPV